MREILFRGKIYGSREWCWGSYESLIHVISWLDENKEYHKKQVIPETVGQFTGLLDKNGTKIFEGDIVETIRSENYGFLPKGCQLAVVWNEDELGYFMGETKYRLTKSKVVKVIGNIHDKGE